MKVLHLVKTGAGAAWALRQARELMRAGVDVHVALPAGQMVKQWATAGIRTHVADLGLPVGSPVRALEVFRACRQLVIEVEPDIIHSHFVATTLTARMALGRNHPVPRVFQVPGPLHLEHGLFRAAEIACSGSRDYWLGSCRWTVQRYLESGVPARRVGLAYYGLDPDAFVPRLSGRLRRELGLAPSARVVGMVAHFYAPKRFLGQSRGLKGHEDFIDAIALCRRSRPEVLGVSVGGPWEGAESYMARVRAYALKRCPDGLIFLGVREDVPELYADFDLTVAPSHSENLGAAAEALALAVPTIATDVGGLPDIVRADQTGWLVPPRDPTALSLAIIDALDHPEEAHRRAQEGRTLAFKLLDLRDSAGTVLDFYERMLADGR